MTHFFLMATLVVLAGCGAPEHSDLKQWMQEQTKTMKGKIPPLPEIKPFPAVSYDGTALIPPFSSVKIISTEVAADKAAPDRDRPSQPLENFPLEDLRVSGIIVDGKVPHALIQTPPPNKPKHVRVGEFIGQNFGKITSITRDSVVVVETVKDANGAWVEREVSLVVPRAGVR
jgi:type IV pilus assembly protein PilP